MSNNDRQQEIRDLLERLRVAWERRPECSLAELFKRALFIFMIPTRELTDEQFITAIEKLCEGKE